MEEENVVATPEEVTEVTETAEAPTEVVEEIVEEVTEEVA